MGVEEWLQGHGHMLDLLDRLTLLLCTYLLLTDVVPVFSANALMFSLS